MSEANASYQEAGFQRFSPQHQPRISTRTIEKWYQEARGGLCQLDATGMTRNDESRQCYRLVNCLGTTQPGQATGSTKNPVCHR